MNDEGLINSRRRFDRLSYSPLVLPTDGNSEPVGGMQVTVSGAPQAEVATGAA